MERILIVHTGGGIGDVLFATPVIDALLHQWPQAEVDFLCRTSTATVLKGHPRLNRLLTLSKKAPSLPLEAMQLARTLKKHRYDAALVLWSTTGIAWTLAMAGIPRRVGQDSRVAYSFLYTDRVKVRSEQGDTESHWTDVLLDYPRALGVTPPPPKVVYTLRPEDRKRAAALIEDLPRRGPLIGFHTGKGLSLTLARWPVDRFAAWVNALYTELDAAIVLTGGPDETHLVDEVERLAGVPCLNLAGLTDLPTLAGLASLCDVFVCPDSGPMHLAAAVGTPVVGIYALDEDFPKRWAPFGVPHRVIRPENRNCRPGCLKASCPDFRCYHAVQAGDVVEAVRSLAEESPTGD